MREPIDIQLLGQVRPQKRDPKNENSWRLEDLFLCQNKVLKRIAVYRRGEVVI